MPGRPLSMHSLKTFAPLVAVAFLAAACNESEIPSTWKSDTLLVDGLKTDWAGIQTYYFEEEGIQLGLTNDSDSLYILLRFTGVRKARMIGMTGLTIWFDPAGNREKAFAVRFPGGAGMQDTSGEHGEMGAGQSGGRKKDEMRAMMEKRINEADEIIVIDGRSGYEESVPADGSQGPRAAATAVKGIYTFEFSLPLARMDVMNYGIDAAAGQTIGLGFEWGLDPGDRPRMTGGRGGMGGGMPGGGMGGRNGMGGRGVPGGAPPGGMMFEKTEFWLKVPLAAPGQKTPR